MHIFPGHTYLQNEGGTTGVPLKGTFPQASPPITLTVDTLHKLVYCTAALVPSRSAFTCSDGAPRLLVSHMDMVFLFVLQPPA